MKREDVKNKITGITEEQPNWLMQENGSDITREKFLSTLSLRRATGGKQSFIRMDRIFLSTLSLRRATKSVALMCPRSRFLSTLSLRRATVTFLF